MMKIKTLYNLLNELERSGSIDDLEGEAVPGITILNENQMGFNMEDITSPEEPVNLSHHFSMGVLLRDKAHPDCTLIHRSSQGMVDLPYRTTSADMPSTDVIELAHEWFALSIDPVDLNLRFIGHESGDFKHQIAIYEIFVDFEDVSQLLNTETEHVDFATFDVLLRANSNLGTRFYENLYRYFKIG